MPYYDDPMTDRAVDHYVEAGGPGAPMPSRSETCRTGDRIHLRSGDTLLAVYRVVVRDGEEDVRRLRPREEDDR